MTALVVSSAKCRIPTNIHVPTGYTSVTCRELKRQDQLNTASLVWNPDHIPLRPGKTTTST